MTRIMTNIVRLESRTDRLRRANPRAGGFTLVEVVIAVSIASFVMGGAAVLLQGVWRVERSTRHHARNLAADFRLAEAFRSDVHLADASAVAQLAGVESADRLALTLADGRTVEYTAGSAQVERVVRRGDETAGRDTFLLKPQATVRWQAGTDGAAMISMLVSAPLGTEQLEMAETRTMRTDATVGMYNKSLPKDKE
jgi:prepilin-type N-terminal cleavage/methylation domain-containing protein